MTTLRLAAALALALVPLAACEGDGDLVAECDEAFAGLDMKLDGMVTLSWNHDHRAQWLAYCIADETGQHWQEYLPLPKSLDNTNESGWVMGDMEPMVTTFTMVAIDPQTLQIDPDNFRYATGPTGMIPFGTAIAKGGIGWAKIDLRGTPFGVPPNAVTATGNTMVKSSNHYQVLELTAGEDGSVVPTDGRLKLRYFGTELPPDEAAAAEVGIELTEEPQP